MTPKFKTNDVLSCVVLLGPVAHGDMMVYATLWSPAFPPSGPSILSYSQLFVWQVKKRFEVLETEG
eukprot:4550427-Amphidinium_carterae.1